MWKNKKNDLHKKLDTTVSGGREWPIFQRKDKRVIRNCTETLENKEKIF